MIHLDTHVGVWLYEKDAKRFPPGVLELIEAEELAVSPMAILELQYLFEIEGIGVRARTIVDHLRDRIGLIEDSAPYSRVVERALEIAWTRDPFDRIIVAQASCQKVRLLTKDLTIRRHFPAAVWDD